MVKLGYSHATKAHRGEQKMRRSLMLVLVVALATLVFTPAAFAQDDNPTGDDLVASPTPSPSSTSSATPDVGASSTTDAGLLPETGGVPLLSAAAGLLLVGSGIAAVMLMGRTS
jgi:hypothetical protein